MGDYGLFQSSYGTLNLTDTSPAQSFIEPLSLVDIKTYLNLPERSPTDTDEDAQLIGFITAARSIAEVAQQRDLVRKQWDLVLDTFSCRWVELRRDLVSVDLVQYRDSGGTATPLTENTDYIVDLAKQPGIISPMYNTSWPSFTGYPSSAVLIRFTAGLSPTSSFWSDIGAVVKQGMLRLISDWFNNRLPFDATTAISEYPYAVTSCLTFGVAPRVR